MRNDIQEKIPQILEWVEGGMPKNMICKKINCRPRTLDSYLKKNGIEYRGNQGGKGYSIAPNKIDDLEWIEKWCRKGTSVSSARIRNRLISAGIKEEKCEECNRDTWNNKKIPLDLHHLDGDRFNNVLENLQILCKNCHGLTETYSIKK